MCYFDIAYGDGYGDCEMKKLLFITLITLSMADTHTCIYHLTNIARESERGEYSLAKTYVNAALKTCDDARAVDAVLRFKERIDKL